MTVIRGLRADLIPTHDWPLRQWFQGDCRYYHGPRRQLPPLGDPKFYRLLDPDLRPLCRLLIEAGLRTTPSCQGHFHPTHRFRRTWDQLHRERNAISGRGLVVRDAEAGQEYLFRDPAYRIPWPDFASFCAQSSADQNSGYLGILIPPDRRDILDPLRQISGRWHYLSLALDTRRQIFGMELFQIQVRTPDPATQSSIWRIATNLVRQALLSAAPAQSA